MSSAESRLFDVLKDLDIEFRLVRHAATHRATDGDKIRETLDMPGLVTKTLLCQDKANHLVMIVAPTSARVDLKGVTERVGAEKRLSFSSPETMQATYGVGPGHLSPLALVNDVGRQTRHVVLDASVQDAALVWGHPLHNEASVGISPESLHRFIEVYFGAPVVANVQA